MSVVEVFADVACPFAHVGLSEFVRRRDAAGRTDVRLHVRAWPLELVNGEPLDAHAVAGKVRSLREQLHTGLFDGFTPAAFPTTTVPAMALTAAAYRRDVGVGERVALELRSLCFGRGVDVGAQPELDDVAARHGLTVAPQDVAQVHADWEEGRHRKVVGSPHFFTPHGDFFCPTLDVDHDERDRLQVSLDTDGLARFLAACFAAPPAP